jgi:hypothetical protein
VHEYNHLNEIEFRANISRTERNVGEWVKEGVVGGIQAYGP